MRVTIESLNNGDHLPLHMGNILVKFDGQMCAGAVAGDDEEGWLEIFDPASKKPEDKEIPTMRIYGKVEFLNAEDLE